MLILASGTTPRRITATLVAVAVLVGGLAGCVPDPAPDPTDAATPTATVTAEPEPGAEPADPGIPIDLDCSDLVSPEVIYAFNPNFGLLSEWTPAADSPAAEALLAEGVACRWLHQTSGDTLDVSVAGLSEAALVARKNAASAESEMVTTYGDEAYFVVEGGVGTATVFSSRYWLVATSTYFLEPVEAADIVDAALAALP